ncbi:alpha-amylase family glycosyl hydrolase [Maricaulis sp.]|uniref:alpha-amylase family glycosyl hydrolase n=1 Tax=Maricaulis sp. TaxID=1486257 RepID=UPI002613E389|nr:alpha-amylase family glycosyl hydrolase [Maricaulis sp.]
MSDTADKNWWRGAVIYQIYPRSYLDTNGDGIGDLPGIIDKLDYIAALGVDGIWISPFFTSPMADFGYDVADFCDVDPVFGTLDDFDRLIAKAHGLGLKVVIDQIYSHTSDQHAWFTASRADRSNAQADWYVWADPKPDGSPPTNWQSFFYGPAWTWDARRGQYYMHNFLPEQPDLNLWNPDVRAAILDTLRFWLDRGVDGVRLDAISHCLHDRDMRDNPPKPVQNPRKPGDMQDQIRTVGLPETAGLMTEIRSVLDEYPGRFAVGEIGGEDPLGQAVTYADPDTTLQTAYNFSFLFRKPLDPALIRDTIEDGLNRHPKGWPTQVFSNHDAVRAPSRWGDASSAFAIQLNALLLSLRGSVCLYQGEELGLPQADIPFEKLVDPEAIKNWPRTLGRDGARTPMPWVPDEEYAGFSAQEPWLPVDARHGPLSVALQEKDKASVLHWTRRLLTLRKAEPALKLGDIRFLDTDAPLLVFERINGDDHLVCAFNLAATRTPLPADITGDMLLGRINTRPARTLEPHGWAILRR